MWCGSEQSQERRVGTSVRRYVMSVGSTSSLVGVNGMVTFSVCGDTIKYYLQYDAIYSKEAHAELPQIYNRKTGV